jgi:lysophospholipase L1-like esterase
MRNGPLKTTLLLIVGRLGILAAGGSGLLAACHAAGTPQVPVAVRATMPAPVPGVRTEAPAAGAPAPARSEVGEPAPTPTTTPAPAGEPWLVFGDSITHDAFGRLDGWAEAFTPDAAPAVRNAGVPGLTTLQGALRIEELLALHPDARRVGLAFGTNDAFSEIVPADAFAARLRDLVDRALAAGREVRVARIPWSPLPKMAIVRDYNRAIRALERELGLAPGPDLYGWFEDHPEQLEADGVHLRDDGDAAVRRLWAEALRAGR